MDSEFEAACAFVRANAGKFEKSDLLYFYGRYKVVTEGVCNTEKPSFYQLTEKSKWQVWHDLGDMDRELASAEYIERLDSLEAEWRGEEVRDPTSGWVSVSCPRNEEQSLPDSEKTVWDWVKEGNLERLKYLVSVDNIEDTDEEGMSLIHWASDRGHAEVVSLLLEVDSQVINKQDAEGQTPLHFAVSCGHEEVVTLLLERGADPQIPDSDGYLPVNSDTDEAIKQIFQKFRKD